MNRYIVEIKEVLTRTIMVNAENEEEAKRIIEEDYKNEKIILDSNDYEKTEIKVIEKL